MTSALVLTAAYDGYALWSDQERLCTAPTLDEGRDILRLAEQAQRDLDELLARAPSKRNA